MKISFTNPFIIGLSLLSGVGLVSAAFMTFSGTIGIQHQYGQFLSDGSGNAGLISFSSNAGINGVDLSGKFSIETLGWATFDVGTRIVAPASGKVTDLWSVSGSISSNAGPITLDNAYFDPNTKQLCGYGMNIGVGKVNFGNCSITTTGTPSTSPADPTSTIALSSGNKGFEGHVKVIGSIGGQSTFDTFYTLDTRYDASLLNNLINNVRKNLALMTRNIPSQYYNADFTTQNIINNSNKLFYFNNDPTVKTLNYTAVMSKFPANIDSLIIKGGDLVIDDDIKVMSLSLNPPKGIIVIKNDAGVGGNIFIKGNVRNIQSTLLAEGTIYSGESPSNIYNDTTEKVATSIPERQLYIYGSVMSRNTIGGSTQSTPICVYGESPCTSSGAIKYDFNYFRNYTASGALDFINLAYPDNTYDAYSVIIERNPRIGTNPPPGFEK